MYQRNKVKNRIQLQTLFCNVNFNTNWYIYDSNWRTC